MKIALLCLILIYLVSVTSAETIQSAMDSVAKSCPGVGNTVTVVDASHIGVTISPGKYATSTDLGNAVATLVASYVGLVQGTEKYSGYLRVGIANVGPDGKNHITEVFETTATAARAQTESTIGDYINLVLTNGKKVTYEYMVDGYIVNWPGYDPTKGLI